MGHRLVVVLSKLKVNDVGSEVLTGVVMKSSVLWDTMPCSPLKINRHFGEHVFYIFRVE
jgi:hypothetical protein